MAERARTKEERFLIALHEFAESVGGKGSVVDRLEVGRTVGLNDRAIGNICRDLAQTNFIRKRGEDLIELTPQGERLVLEILNK